MKVHEVPFGSTQAVLSAASGGDTGDRCCEVYSSLRKHHLTNWFSSFLRELSRFIAAGRLHCKIDKVNEIVETNR